MRHNILTILFSLLISISVASAQNVPITIADKMRIIKLSENTLIHEEEVYYESFGNVACNGLIYISNNEAVIMDTPPTDEMSRQLIEWLNKTYPNVTIKGVVVNHFHNDCLGGLKEFQKRGIKSYSYKLTPELAQKEKAAIPETTFDKELKIKVGNKVVECYYFGEAHTKDNIVTWLPDEKILFGGCPVKALNASKGNLEDANIKEWSNTISKAKEKFADAKVVVPGHGQYGGIELLDYTIKLFDEDRKN
jgi:metallo-beta-lactamase class B